MYFRATFLLTLSLLAVSSCTLQSTIDVSRLQGILKDGVSSKDASSLYFSIKGLMQLNANVPNVCESIKNAKYDIKNIEQVFHVAAAASMSNCLSHLKPEVLSAPVQVLEKKDATIQELYYAVYTMKSLGKGTIYDKEDGLKNLIQLLKKDDSPANYGYVFALCEHMGCASWSVSHAEGVLLAADESDSKALHFEGGLPVTSLLLGTIVRTYKSQRKPTPLTEEQRYKFAEYLLSRRSVNTPKGAALLIEAALALADDNPSPISISIKGKKYVTADSESIEVAVTDLLGRAVQGLKPDDVIAQSGTRLADDVVVLSKQALTQKDPTTFVLNLSKIKAQYGLYKIVLSAAGKTANLNIAVLGEIKVDSVEVGVGDVDGTTSPKLTTVSYPNKLSEKLQADHLQKVSLKFTVRDKFNKPVTVQQAFVRVANEGTDDEAIFVAEPDNTKAYKVELSVSAISSHLRSSGAHSLSLFVGDSAAAAPILWHVGDIVFNFGKQVAAVAGSGKPPRGPRAEISHMFRAAEPRPPRLVSDVFACACAAPLLLLLGLWASLRVNCSMFPFTPAALLFHAALGGSLCLYGMLWLKLTMFETLRYLVPLGGLTFLSGQRLLKRLVNDKAHQR